MLSHDDDGKNNSLFVFLTSIFNFSLVKLAHGETFRTKTRVFVDWHGIAHFPLWQRLRVHDF